ncbi:MAG: type II secretion system protein [Planctomycetota bacterium]|nr:type II secretion system protein [Planctomycetota bacterium]
MKRLQIASSARAGFTLIEILAVMLVIGILFTFLMRSGMGGVKSVERKQTETFLKELDAIIEDYSAEFNAYPPSTPGDDIDTKPTKTNVGVETLVITLYRRDRGWQARDVDADRLSNTDEDYVKGMANFENPDAYEFKDSWDNPIAYIHRRDYGKALPYLVVTGDGEELESFVEALKSSKTGDYYRKNKFQLISAGPDGEFGTDDDIANFNIEK